MKRYFLNIFVGLGLVLFSSSCNNYLNPIPQQNLSDTIVFSDINGLNAAVNGCYNAITTGSNVGFSTMIGDFTTRNVNFNGSFTTLQDIRDGINLADNATTSGMWQNLYFIINACNNVIVNGANISGVTTQIAEARFVRAYAYFELWKNWGLNAIDVPAAGSDNSPCVPLVTQPFVSFDPVANRPARSTNIQIYNFIVSELEACKASLPGITNTASRQRANSVAANALLARAYLYKGDLTNALNRTQDVLTALGGNPSLPALVTPPAAVLSVALINWKNTFNSAVANSEALFYPTSDNIANAGVNAALGSFYMPSSLAGRGDFNLTGLGTTIQNVYTAADLRFTRVVIQTSGGAPPATNFAGNPFKFTDSQTLSDGAPILRLAEVLLTRAEALVRQNNTVDPNAVTLLNQVRTRAITGYVPVTPASFANANALLTAILQERRLELAFEGHFRYDILRTGNGGAGTLGVTLGLGTDWTLRNVAANGTREQFPIPFREIQQNANLVQNPGY